MWVWSFPQTRSGCEWERVRFDQKNKKFQGVFMIFLKAIFYTIRLIFTFSEERLRNEK